MNQPYNPQQPYSNTPPYAQEHHPDAFAQPQQPYSAVPPYPPAPFPAASQFQAPPYRTEQKPKKKAWPWVLGGCLSALLLFGLPGCVGCTIATTTIRALVASNSSYDSPYQHDDSSNKDESQDDSDNGYYNYLYNLYHGDKATDTTDTLDPYLYSQFHAATHSFGEITSALKVQAGDLSKGSSTSGFYRIEAEGQVAPGLYYLGGASDAINRYYVFKRIGSLDSYELASGEPYLGNHYAKLEEGDVLVYLAASDSSARIVSADNAAVILDGEHGEGKEGGEFEHRIIRNGLYRIGVDIPAGTYRATPCQTAIETSDGSMAEITPMLWVTSELDYREDGEILDKREFVTGSVHTVTLEDGQWVELFDVQMEPVFE